MPITHVNAKGKTYDLHQGATKTGKPKYHFAMKSEGILADAIPEGFEIYENPNAQRCSAIASRALSMTGSTSIMENWRSWLGRISNTWVKSRILNCSGEMTSERPLVTEERQEWL